MYDIDIFTFKVADNISSEHVTELRNSEIFYF